MRIDLAPLLLIMMVGTIATCIVLLGVELLVR